MMLVSSAYSQRMLPGVTGTRSEAVTSYDAGPVADPCIILADI